MRSKGQHIKEFTEFLLKHPDTFQVIDGESVLLVGCENLQELPLSERLHLPQPSIDTKATQQLLDFIAQCIENKGPILVDQLFHIVTSKFPQEQWYSMFKTPNDLSTFLKLFSDCFHIHANLVTLLHRPKLSDSYIQQVQARTRDQFNNNYRTQSPIQRNATKINNNGPDFKVNEPVSNQDGGESMSLNNNKSEPNSGFDSFIPETTENKLDNLCERNCPNFVYTTGQQVSSLLVHQTSPATSPASNNVDRSAAAKKNQTLKQRINNLVIKTLAENLEKDKQTMTNYQQHQYGAAPQGTAAAIVNSNSGDGRPTQTNTNSNFNIFAGDTWKIKILQNTRVISTIKESLFVTEAILRSAANDQVVVSVDCEGINLGVKGQITLIEIGTTRGEAFIFDILTCPQIIPDGGLKVLLESEDVIKVIHDCRNDSVNLYHQFNVLLRNVFDTQSAHTVLQYQDHGKQIYKVKNVSLNTLCELYNAPINPMKDQLKCVYRRDQKYWARRPLTREMLLYAAGDVLVLINNLLFSTLAK